MGYLKHPDIGYAQHELTYYKPLIPYNKPSDEKSVHLIALWDTERYYAQQRDPKWIWNIDKKFKGYYSTC